MGSVLSRLVQNEVLSIINYTKMSLFYSNTRKLGDFVDFLFCPFRGFFFVSMTFDRRDTPNLGWEIACIGHASISCVYHKIVPKFRNSPLNRIVK